MKRKQFIAAIISLLLIFAMAGCSNSQDSSQANPASNGNGNSANGFGKPDVYGEVSKIDGNKVSLKLLKIPQVQSGNRQRNWQGNGQNGNGQGNWQGNGQGGNSQGNWQGNGQGGNGQGNWQGNGQGGNGQGNGRNWQNGGNGGNGGFRGGGFGGMRQRQYTGQTKTIDIPSNASLVTITRGQNGMAETDISLKDVTVGSLLSIFYKEDGKTIDKIRVMQPRTGGGQGNNQGNVQGGNSGGSL